MKKAIIIFLTVIYLHCDAQTTTPQVISSAGWYATGNGVELSQTIGEMSMVSTLSVGSIVLTQGFEQPELIYPAGIADFAAGGGALALFPNPAADQFALLYSFAQPGDITVTMYNSLGKKISKDYFDKYIGGDQVLHLSGSDLAPGIYLIKTQFSTPAGDQYVETKKMEIIK